MANTARCPICDVEVDAYGPCPTCRRELSTLAPLAEPLEAARWDLPAPRVGVHVAGAEIDLTQWCALCGDILACRRDHLQSPWPDERDWHVPPANLVPWTAYPEGALVERGRGWQAMKLSGGATCQVAA